MKFRIVVLVLILVALNGNRSWGRNACVVSTSASQAPEPSGADTLNNKEWRFVVSGDSRNCGDLIMPAVAKGAAGDAMAFAGSDCGDYPGDDKIQAWTVDGTYKWCGYYLLAPCHGSSFSPWTGK